MLMSSELLFQYVLHILTKFECRDIYSGLFPQGGGEQFLAKLKNREEFEGGLEKRKEEKGGKEEKKKRVIKNKLTYLYEA